MDDALLVGVVQRLGHLPGDRHRLLDGKLRLVVQPVAQRLARDVRHGIEQHRRAVASGSVPDSWIGRI